VTPSSPVLSNYANRQTPQFRVLSERQCQELYLASLECLSRVGVLVNHDEARQLLAAAGARIQANRVFIPPHIIQDALTVTPPTFTLWGRDGVHQIQVASERVYFGPGPTCTYYLDPETGERRKSRRGDAASTARVVDALPNIDYAMSLSLFDDVQPMLSPVYEFAEMIANTGKPVVAWANDLATLQDIYRIAAVVAGGEDALQRRPIFAYFANYESPLRHGEKQLANMLWAAEHGVPVVYLGGPTVGQESPATGASGLVIYLAAALSGLAIVQLKRRGAPTVIGGLPSAMDLRTARPAYGSPEMVLHVAAAAELARYLGVPFMGTAGASESKKLDAQAGAEIGLQIMTSALSGACLVHDVGFLDCADIGSLPLLVFADEVISMVKRMMRGLEVSRETIMLDLIEKVGPAGHFMAEPESVALCRREIWVPGLMDRNAYVIWEQKGGKSLEQRVDDRLRKILSAHSPPALPDGAAEAIQEILAQAEERYGRTV
jgi:trimethylamine--corrinoid protein Co-methyltransferase